MERDIPLHKRPDSPKEAEKDTPAPGASGYAYAHSVQVMLEEVDCSFAVLSCYEGRQIMTETYYAHSDPRHPGKGPETPGARWQLLECHLGEVATLSSDFAKRFESQDWGYLAGLWHDLGKYRSGFQGRLRGATIRVNHAGVGAALALELDSKTQKGLPLTFVIAGHHGGLHNHQAAPRGETRLVDRLRDYAAELEECRGSIPDQVRNRRLPDFPGFLVPQKRLSPDEADALCILCLTNLTSGTAQNPDRMK